MPHLSLPLLPGHHEVSSSTPTPLLPCALPQPKEMRLNSYGPEYLRAKRNLPPFKLLIVAACYSDGKWTGTHSIHVSKNVKDLHGKSQSLDEGRPEHRQRFHGSGLGNPMLMSVFANSRCRFNKFLMKSQRATLWMLTNHFHSSHGNENGLKWATGNREGAQWGLVLMNFRTCCKPPGINTEALETDAKNCKRSSARKSERLSW